MCLHTNYFEIYIICIVERLYDQKHPVLISKSEHFFARTQGGFEI